MSAKRPKKIDNQQLTSTDEQNEAVIIDNIDIKSENKSNQESELSISNQKNGGE